MLGQVSAVFAALVAAAPGGAPGRDRGSFVETPAAAWPERELRPTGVPARRAPRGAARGLAPSVGEVAIVEGDASFVSGIDGALGVRFDETRNDLGALVARYVETFGDARGVLVFATTFEDVGAAGPAYFVPIFDDTEGTGRGAVDQRADFGTAALEGVIDLKRLDRHGDRVLLVLAHEIAHRHLAYLSVQTASSTVTRTLTGRQGAHWHAALHTSGSLLGGYAWRSSSMGRFVVIAKETTLSDLDLYALGLLHADAVAPFFFLDGLRTEGGAALPAAAELTVGATALGTRVDLTIDDVLRAHGPRVPAAGDAPTTIPLVFAIVTAPGETATSTRATQLANEVDALRGAIEVRWAELTRDLGRVTTTRAEAHATDAGVGDAGSIDAGPPAHDDGGCACTSVAPVASTHVPGTPRPATSPTCAVAGLALAGLGAIVRKTRRTRSR